MSEEIVVVVAGGAPPHADAVRAIPVGAPVVAADRGLDHARALGLEVTIAVGDFDSASPEAVAAAEAEGVRIERYPEEKDTTDLELALDAALELDPGRILVLAEGGGRLDHLLSTFLLLASPRYAEVELDAYLGRARLHVIRGARALHGEAGELVSLFALNSPAKGVRTEGLMYPLAGETLESGSSLGVSNRFVGEHARVVVERGVLVAVRPGVDR